MKLGDWLKANNLSRTEFAKQVGCSPSNVTLLCAEPPSWPGRELAERIRAATGGEVTPNDFLPPIGEAVGSGQLAVGESAEAAE